MCYYFNLKFEASQWVGWCIGPSGRFFIFWTFFLWILPRSSAHVCALCAFACWVSDLRGCSCFPFLYHLCPQLLMSASAARWLLHSFFFCGLCAVVLLLMLAFMPSVWGHSSRGFFCERHSCFNELFFIWSFVSNVPGNLFCWFCQRIQNITIQYFL